MSKLPTGTTRSFKDPIENSFPLSCRRIQGVTQHRAAKLSAMYRLGVCHLIDMTRDDILIEFTNDEVW
jgi:hypothetical protein